MADWIASKIIAAESAPSCDLTISAPLRLAQTSSWSIAPALNVSPAAIRTLFPSFLRLCANLPIDVVLPTPLTPTNKNTESSFSEA